jgi:hypothetical protein
VFGVTRFYGMQYFLTVLKELGFGSGSATISKNSASWILIRSETLGGIRINIKGMRIRNTAHGCCYYQDPKYRILLKAFMALVASVEQGVNEEKR